MPVELYDPEDDGPIKVYAGDPLTVQLRMQGINWVDRAFSADVRRSGRAEEVLASFDISVVLDTPDTVITLSMPGDSAPGALDSPTRKITGTAEMDVQRWYLGRAEPTVAHAKLQRVLDVTR